LVDFGEKRGQLPTQCRIPLVRENASIERSGFDFKCVYLSRVFHGLLGQLVQDDGKPDANGDDARAH